MDDTTRKYLTDVHGVLSEMLRVLETAAGSDKSAQARHRDLRGLFADMGTRRVASLAALLGSDDLEAWAGHPLSGAEIAFRDRLLHLLHTEIELRAAAAETERER